MHSIVHLTSAHSRDDMRIFFKQCRTLVQEGYDVALVVADGKGEEYREGIRIYDVGRQTGRLGRMIKTTKNILEKAVALNAEIYQLHDPELLPVGLKLKRLGKKVVFDSHEDVPRQILHKPYLDSISQRFLSNTFALFERYACAQFDGIIAATPYIRDKFLSINLQTVDVNNFPLLGELDTSIPWDRKHPEVCYVGSIGAIRGIREIVRACELLQSPTRLNLAGSFSEPELETEVKSYPGWSKVNVLGFLDRAGVRKTLERSMAGLVTLHPVINYLDALPVKMFEYMAAGIPVIASDFPLWRKIVEGNQCGLLVDPLNPKSIAEAIDYLIMHPDIARSMGSNGRKAVIEKYNWPIQAEKLTEFYGVISHV